MRLTTAIISLLLTLTATAAPTASEVMKRVSDRLTSPASVTVAFTLRASEGDMRGTMTMSRKLFTFSAGNIAVWYDGTTQWTLVRSAREVSITTPAADELIESNPFYIISEYTRHYSSRLLTAPRGQYRVELTAKSRSSAVRRATLTVNARTWQPLSMTAVTAGGTLNITVISVSTGRALPRSYFTYSPRMNKDIEIIDLR